MRAGLIQHPGKKRRKVDAGVLLGCEIDGLIGLACAPRPRIVILAALTGFVAKQGSCTPDLLSTILGCWVHVLLYRRPALCVLDSSFRAAQGLPKHQVFRLPSACRNELLCFASLACTLVTDLRVKYSEDLYALNASPLASGICHAGVGQDVTRELWRHCEQRGLYTRFEEPATALLREIGLDPEPLQLSEDPSVQRPAGFPCRVPQPLVEGFLWDCIEIFRGEGSWSEAHEIAGLSVHDGGDLQGRRLRYLDLSDAATFRELGALALRRVIRDWHAGPPCLTFGTLRRPRVRSKYQPFGFDLNDPLTALHNRLAIRTGILIIIVISGGGFVSAEQPGSSVMFRLDIFVWIAARGCALTRLSSCTYGSPLKKPFQFLHNKPWLLDLAGQCSCRYRGRHFVAQGTFTRDNLQTFRERCIPDCVTVFRREPTPGESVARFSGSYPFPLMQRFAAGSAAAKHSDVPVLPLTAAFSALAALSDLTLPELPDSGFEVAARAPFHEASDWVVEELLRYRFKASGHINVLEARTYKTWIKHLAHKQPACRAVALLDSRVTLGAAAKGRSSSPAISRVLQGTLPYILGGCLYPGGLHVPTASNPGNDPSRWRPVRPPSRNLPAWFELLQRGQTWRFDVMISCSSFPRPLGRWLRLLLLLAGDVERQPGPVRQPLPRGPLDLQSGFTQVLPCLPHMAP